LASKSVGWYDAAKMCQDCRALMEKMHRSAGHFSRCLSLHFVRCDSCVDCSDHHCIAAVGMCHPTDLNFHDAHSSFDAGAGAAAAATSDSEPVKTRLSFLFCFSLLLKCNCCLCPGIASSHPMILNSVLSWLPMLFVNHDILAMKLLLFRAARHCCCETFLAACGHNVNLSSTQTATAFDKPMFTGLICRDLTCCLSVLIA